MNEIAVEQSNLMTLGFCHTVIFVEFGEFETLAQNGRNGPLDDRRIEQGSTIRPKRPYESCPLIFCNSSLTEDLAITRSNWAR